MLRDLNPGLPDSYARLPGGRRHPLPVGGRRRPWPRALEDGRHRRRHAARGRSLARRGRLGPGLPDRRRRQAAVQRRRRRPRPRALALRRHRRGDLPARRHQPGRRRLLERHPLLQLGERRPGARRRRLPLPGRRRRPRLRALEERRHGRRHGAPGGYRARQWTVDRPRLHPPGEPDPLHRLPGGDRHRGLGDRRHRRRHRQDQRHQPWSWQRSSCSSSRRSAARPSSPGGTA